MHKITMKFESHVVHFRSLQREDLLKYISEHYRGPRMVLAAAGGVDHEKLVDLGRRYFGDLGGVDEDFIAEPGKFVASYVRHHFHFPKF